jgi:hypothetical protein
LFNKILYSVFIACDETRETVKLINSLSGFISLLLFVQSQVIQQNFHECCEQATRVSFKFVCKMRAGVVHKVILSVSLVYIVSVYLSM